MSIKLNTNSITALWALLLIFDISIGLNSWALVLISVLAISTAVIVSKKKDIGRFNLIHRLIWSVILGWLIFVVYGLLIERFFELLPIDKIFIFQGVLTWSGLLSILVASLLFPPFANVLFKKEAIWVCVIGAGWASLLALSFQWGNDLFPVVEGIALVAFMAVFCWATWCVAPNKKN